MVGGDRLRHRFVQREDVDEPGDTEEVVDPPRADDEPERPARETQSLEAAHQGTEAGGVHELRVAQIRDDVQDAVGEKLDHPLTHLRGGIDVDLAGDPQDGAVAADGDGFQLKERHRGLRPTVITGIDNELHVFTVDG